MNTLAPLTNCRLTQVVFVHDYLQLVFDDIRLSLYAPVVITSSGKRIGHLELGHADAIVRLVGHAVTSASCDSECELALHFSNGDILNVSLQSTDAVGPETFQLNVPGKPIVVGRVA